MVDQLLLVLQVAFVVLLYLFIWRVIRAASRDLAVGQESMILAPMRAGGGAPLEPAPASGRLVVVASPELEDGAVYELGREHLIGRAADADLSLPSDGYASGRHARFVPGRERDAVVDLESTNGTFVNGERLEGTRALAPGDVVTVGQTQLEYRR